MAVIYGSPGGEAGDRRVYEALKNLPTGTIVYAQPLLVHKSERCEPDYIIVDKNWGVIVLEVKDWVNVQEIDRYGLYVFRTDRKKWEFESSPIDQARKAALCLTNMLQEDDDLRNYCGKLDFSYTYGAVLPNLPTTVISNCNYKWGEGYVLGGNDLGANRITEKVEGIPTPFRCLMTETQVRAVCAIIDPSNKLADKSTGTFKGSLDSTQESIVKEDIVPPVIEPEIIAPFQNSLFTNLFPEPEVRKQHLESEVPSEVIEMQANMHVRLVRGFAGTGKTDVLVLRAQYLAEHYQDKRILVTTFNDPLYQKRLLPELEHVKTQVDVVKFDTLCAEIYKKRHGIWKTPQASIGLVAKLAESNVDFNEWGEEFLADEFNWMKEASRTDKLGYLNKPREGRGGSQGRMLSKAQKMEVFSLFLLYQEELTEMSAYDWADLHDKTYKYLEEGIEPNKYYDVILIDEAQHFAPIWMDIIKKFLNPEGVLFLCDDPSQSVFRFFSWRQKGIDVVGKTRWLRVPYRNTRQIFTAAFSLIAEDDLAKNLLREDKAGAMPDLNNPNLRDGKIPVVKQFENIKAEKEYICKEINQLIERGLRPQEICILHSKPYVLKDCHEIKKQGVSVENSIAQTGMEYTAVFIPQVQKLFERTVGIGFEEDQSQQRLTTYMLMTRARSNLYLTYQQKWPVALNGLRPYVEWEEIP